MTQPDTYATPAAVDRAASKADPSLSVQTRVRQERRAVCYAGCIMIGPLA